MKEPEDHLRNAMKDQKVLRKRFLPAVIRIMDVLSGIALVILPHSCTGHLPQIEVSESTVESQFRPVPTLN